MPFAPIRRAGNRRTKFHALFWPRSTTWCSPRQLWRCWSRDFVHHGEASPKEYRLPFSLLAPLIINNVICAVGSGVNDRYQARVTWLVAFSALLIFARLLRAEEVTGTSRRPAELAAAPTVGASNSVASQARLRSGGALAYGKSEAN